MATGSDVSHLIGRKPLWRRWRVVTSVILVGVIAGAGYYGLFRDQKTAATATTQEAKVTLGSLSTTLTASGTAAAEQSTPLTFTTGGLVTEVLVRLGAEIKAGEPLVRVDSRDARRKLETARDALVQAQLRLQQLLEPSAVDRTAMQQSLVSARTQLESAQAAYTNLGRPTASELFTAEQAVASARASLQSAENSVSSTRSSLYSSQNNYCKLWQEATLGICTPDKLPISDEFVAMLEKSIARDTSVPSDNLISAVTSLISANSSHINSLSSRDSAAASVASAELKLKELTTPTAEAIRSARAAVETAQASYDSVQARAQALAQPAALDLAVQQQSLRSAEIAVQEAQDALDDTTLVAPFSGKAGAVTAVVGQRIGAGTAAVVLSNPDAIRLDLTISESDLVNVKAGMLGLARFDSLPRNAYVVRVVGVSAVPTVTQGVVTYPVQAAILRGNALNDIRDQLPALTRALTSGASGAQLSAILGGGTGGVGGQRSGAPGGSGAPGAQGGSGAGGAQGGQRAQGSGTPGSRATGTPASAATGASGATAASGTTGAQGRAGSGTPSGASGPRGASGATGAGGAAGGIAALFDASLPAAGMNASVTLLVSVVENQLLVPSGAVRRQGNQQFVYTPASAPGGAPVQKAVVTAGTDGTNTAITSGLAEGDTVLLGAIGTATPAATRTTAPGGGGPAIGGGGGPGRGIR